MAEITFADFLEPIGDVLAGERAVVVGGLPTAAILAPGAVFDSLRRRILLPHGALRGLPITRPNGSVRDLDGFIFSDQGSETQRVQEKFQKALQGFAVKPEISFSGYDPDTYQRSWVQFVSRTVRREVDGSVCFELGPVTQCMPAKDFETPWHIHRIGIDGPGIPMLSPYTHAWRYMTRSAGGLRPRDEKKVMDMFVALSKVGIPRDVVDVAYPLEEFANRIENEIRLSRLPVTHDLRLPTMVLTRKLAAIFDGNEWLLELVQSNSGPVASIAKRHLMRHNYTSTAV